MKKKLIAILAFLVIFLLICGVLFKFNKKENKLEKVRVADTTITSWTQ